MFSSNGPTSSNVNIAGARAHRWRKKMLVGAVTAGLAAGAAGTASAQSYGMISIARSPWGQTLNLYNYLQLINNPQAQLGTINGVVIGASEFYGGTIVNGQPSSLFNNRIYSDAVGNNAPTMDVGGLPLPGNSIDLGLLGAQVGPPAKSGLGILSGQVDTGGVNARVNNAAIETDLSGHRTGDVSQGDNAIFTAATGNNASNGISGVLPAATFSGSTAGVSSVVFGIPAPNPTAATILARGDLTVTNSQSNSGNAGLKSTVSNADIGIHDSSTGSVSAAFTNDSNLISAAASGNVSSNGIAATGAAGAPVYNGSTVLTNAQGNLLASATATVRNATIGTTIDGGANFTGTLDQSSNTILAAAQGNQSVNALTFADGINIQGDSALVGLGLNTTHDGNTLNTLEFGDLVSLNVQSNIGAFKSSVSGSSILASVNAVSTPTASVTLDHDAIQAGSGGNTASNVVSVSGTSFDATASVGNLQANYSSPISSTIGNATIGVLALDGGTSRGNVDVSSNAISARAMGNEAITKVDLAATDSMQTGHAQLGLPVTVTSGAADGTGVTDGGLQSGGAGINVGNLQGNYKFTFGNVARITANVTDPGLGALYNGSINAGAVTVDTNAIKAQAGGNAADTALDLTATNANALTAALANSQFNNSPVKATLSGSPTTGALGISLLNGTISNANLSVSDNVQSALARGNDASNTLATHFTHAALGDVSTTWSHPSNVIDPVAGSNGAYAALTLLSNQSNNSDISAAVHTVHIAVALAGTGGNVSDSALSLDGNQINADALANRVDNTLSPDVGTLNTNGGTAAQIAALGNLQQDFGSTVSAQIQPTTDADVGQVYVSIPGNVTADELSLSDNLVRASAGGNDAVNALSLGGSVFAPTPASIGNDGQSSFSGGVVTTTAAFSVQNVQSSNGGSRSANINYASIESYLGSAAATARDSSFTYNANAIQAQAYDNRADNGLALGTTAVPFTALDTTAALQNVQTSMATVSSTLRNTAIGFQGLGNVRDSTLSVTANDMSALAQGNVVSNALQVDAGQLAGDSLNLATPANLRGALPSASLVIADYGLSNSQTRPDSAGAVTTTLNNLNAAISAATGSIQGGALGLTDNVMGATAQVNQATNALEIQADNSVASAAVLNAQDVGIGDAANARINLAVVEVYAGGGLNAPGSVLPVTVSDNRIDAVADLNAASNSLVAGGKASIGTAGVGAAGATNDPSVFAGYTGAVADFALASNQQAASSAKASVSGAAVKIDSGASVTNSSWVLSGNALNALVSANDVSNVLNLSGATSVSASAALANVQNATGGTITASIADSGVAALTPNGGNIRNAAVTISGNLMLASASGNSALNALSVLPAALNIGNAEATLASVTGSAYTATSSYSLLNAQNNLDAIRSTVTDSQIGLNPASAGLASPLLASNAVVGGNTVAAQAFGNSASNAISLAMLTTGVGSSALVSNQINSADITARVSNVHIGVTAGANSSSPVTVSGNTISATAIGNSVVNRIGFGLSP